MNGAAIFASRHADVPAPPTRPSPTLLLLADGARAAAAGDTLAALTAYAAARARCGAAAAPVLAAELDRRLDRLALGLRPPAGVERAGADLAAPATRAWIDRVLRLPPPVVLLALARARWFLPAAGPPDPRRTALARAVLDGLARRRPPVDAHLRGFLLAGPLILPEAAPLLVRGLASHAAGDDLTALHLLVPGVEPLLRRLLAAGAAPMRPSGGREGAGPTPSGLDGLLRAPTLRRALGAGLVTQLRAVLLAGGRDGLRHRLAHGRLPATACTRRAAQDVILCYLRLSRLPMAVAAPPAGRRPRRAAGPATTIGGDHG